MYLKAKADAINEYDPNWWEAICSNFYDDYWKASCKEVEILYKMGSWKIVNLTPYMNVL